MSLPLYQPVPAFDIRYRMKQLFLNKSKLILLKLHRHEITQTICRSPLPLATHVWFLWPRSLSLGSHCHTSTACCGRWRHRMDTPAHTCIDNQQMSGMGGGTRVLLQFLNGQRYHSSCLMDKIKDTTAVLNGQRYHWSCQCTSIQLKQSPIISQLPGSGIVRHHKVHKVPTQTRHAWPGPSKCLWRMPF